MVTPNVRLTRLIGCGAMGDVWEAEHLGLKTRVAVKFVSERVGPGDTEAMERFAREAALPAQISSAHVVQKFDHGVMDDGTPYIVMEYLEGEGLGELLTRETRLPLAKVAKIIWQTAKALSSAHKLGIVHRDIKPDNIFLSTRDDELHVKLFDFGVAKHTQLQPVSLRMPGATRAEMGLTNDGVMIGTPEYMSPEQVMSSRAVDHYADLWALAVVTYVALTGKLPFEGDDVGELCVRLLEGEYTPPSTVLPSLPPQLDDWFKKAFAKNRPDRFQSAREMAQAFVLVPGSATVAGEESAGFDTLPLAVPGAQRVSFTSGFPSQPDIGLAARGPRAATFSGASADADVTLVDPRRRTSIIAAAVVVGLLCVIVIAVMATGSSSEEPSPAQAPTADKTAEPPPSKVSAPVEREPASDNMSPDASATPHASGTLPLVPRRPVGKPWIEPPSPAKAKDPGF
jgi:serine/threonine-protein kinase